MLGKISLTLGRFLLGFYFLMPGLSKVSRYETMSEYMALHNVPLVNILLPVTIILQIAGGLMLMAGYRMKESALVLAALTLIINLGMHDFWNEYANTDSAHEMQNFIKNLAIFAGLLAVSASYKVEQWRLFGGRK